MKKKKTTTTITSTTTNTNNSKPQEPMFKLGDIVGAKVKGHPLWPGFIEDIQMQPKNRRKYTVRFYGSNDKAANFQEIKFFNQMTASELSCKKRGFQEALALCREESKSKSPIRKKREPKSISNLQCAIKQGGDRSERLKLKDIKVDPDVELEMKQGDEELRELKLNQDSELHIKKEKEQQEENDDDDDNDDEEEATSLHINSSPNVSIDEESPCRSPLVQPSQINGVEDAQLKNTNCDLKTKSPRAKSKVPETGEENVMQSLTDRDTIIAKIQRKVSAKLQEKETRKQEKKYQRLVEKASKKYPIIETKLLELSSAFVKLSKFNGHVNVVKWNITVRNYNALLPILEKCIKKYFMTEQSQNYKERKECQETLRKLVGIMKNARKKNVPSQLKLEIRKMIRELKKRQVLKDFIQCPINGVETSKNAMTERNAVELSCG